MFTRFHTIEDFWKQKHQELEIAERQTRKPKTMICTSFDAFMPFFISKLLFLCDTRIFLLLVGPHQLQQLVVDFIEQVDH